MKMNRIDITKLNENDRAVWDMISEGRVKGCFQIESYLGKKWCKAVRPDNILELAALISIIRPGTLKAFVDGKSMTQHYVDRKHGQDKVPSLHPAIDKLLEETYGVIVYQEQAMEIAVKMAEFNLKEADDLRKAIGKKKVSLMKQVRVKFIDGSKKNNVEEDKATEIFDMIEKSARYSFNKSHAVAYAKMAYWSAYIKNYYIDKFMKNWLRDADDKIDPDMEKRQLIMAARAEGLEIKGPSISVLEENFTFDMTPQLNGMFPPIRFGVCNVKNVGAIHLQQLKDSLSSISSINWSNLLVHVLPNVNKRAIENLISVGAFAGLGKSRTEMIHEFHCFSDFTKKEMQSIREHLNINNLTAAEIVKNLLAYGVKKNGGFISTQSRYIKIEDILKRIQNPGRNLADNSITYARIEEKLLGYAINHSELNACSDACHANATCKELTEGRADNCVVAVIIKVVREHKTKNGDIMAFVSAEDDSGELENIVIFPDVYEQNKDIIYDRATVLLSGQIKDKARNSFIIDKVFSI